MPNIQLLDGKKISFNKVINGFEIIKKISKSLEKKALIMEVDGQLKDLSYEIEMEKVGEFACKMDLIETALMGDLAACGPLASKADMLKEELSFIKREVENLLDEASNQLKKIEEHHSKPQSRPSDDLHALSKDYEVLVGEVGPMLAVIDEDFLGVSVFLKDLEEYTQVMSSDVLPVFQSTKNMVDYSVMKCVARQIDFLLANTVEKRIGSEKIEWANSIADFLFQCDASNYVSAEFESKPTKVTKLVDRERLISGLQLVQASVRLKWDWDKWRDEFYNPLEAVVASQAKGLVSLRLGMGDPYPGSKLGLTPRSLRVLEDATGLLEEGYVSLFFIESENLNVYFCSTKKRISKCISGIE